MDVPRVLPLPPEVRVPDIWYGSVHVWNLYLIHYTIVNDITKYFRQKYEFVFTITGYTRGEKVDIWALTWRLNTWNVHKDPEAKYV